MAHSPGAVHRQFIEGFKRYLALTDKTPATISAELKKDFGIEWSVQRMNRVLRGSTTTLSLDEYSALAAIAQQGIDELASTERSPNALHKIRDESFKDFTDGMQRMYFAVFDILNGRSRFLHASRRLNELELTTNPPDPHVARWFKVFASIDTNLIHTFTTTIVAQLEQMEATNKREPGRVQSIDHDEWVKQRDAEAMRDLKTILRENS